MSFGVRNAIKKNINGSFRLLPQSTGRCQNAPITTDHTYSSEYRTYEDTETTIKMCESQSSAEEIIAIDDIDNDLRKSTCKTVLSEQQKLADENLFLRYLELDPTEGPEAIPAALQRKATGNKNGRTPFTTTKKLTRQPKTGFGFSVVWTHPPRIERVEKGLPADKAGILPGDYIIFVDKHNVVMMPEIDILNLIRSYGNQLTLEIFRRNASRNGSLPSVRRLVGAGTGSTTGLPAPSLSTQRRPSTVCSTTNTTSVDYNRRRLQLPQVTFSAEKPTNSQEEARKKAMYQLVSKEQQYATGLQFAITRFVSSLAERKDLITPTEHRILFQNSDELLRITEDILDNLVPEDGDPQLHLLARTYHSKVGEIISAYKKYCSGIKKSDCVLANKTKNSNSDFVRFLQVPAIPRRRPDITAFIHKPLEHYRDVLKLFNVILSNMKANDDDYPVISQIVHDLQITYREITSEGGLMEPLGEGRPLLSVQDLENRLVFTKCKPFVLSKPGRQWIFGGDLSRVEGRNTPQYVNHSENAESHKQIDELIEHKCKQLGKSNASHKGSAIHLEQWMKGQLGTGINAITPEEESEFEVWTEEMFRKRCEELQIPDGKNKNIAFRSESRCEEINISDIDRSPSRSTTSESQVTVRSSPVVPETVTVCRQCHRTCLTNQNGAPYYSNNNTDKNNFVNTKDSKANMKQLTNSNNNENEDWQPLMLMGLSAINPAASLIKFDPFATPVPQISIVPPTPDLLKKNYKNYNQFKETNCNCQNNKTQVTNEVLNNDYDISPDDSSPQTEDQPYHSLSSSNLTLRRFGTVSSLERVGSEENQDDVDSDEENSSESYEEETEKGFDNEAFNHSAIRSWTARAGSYVAEKMSFFEKLGEDYKAGSKFFERYLKTTEVQMNGDDGQEEETSGATSGEEIWGTPTSGGEMDDTLNSPNFDGRRSPNEDSLSSNGDDTEFMMDELLMTPPVTGATIRGLLPRRTLEPLMEEEYSDTYTSSSSSASESVHTEPSASPEQCGQGNVTGNAADECSAAAENPQTIKNSEESDIPAVESQYNWIAPRIHRSDSYRHIIEAEDDNPTFFTRFKPTIKFLNIERIPRSRGVKLLEFFNVKRAERRVHESFPGNRPLLKVFSKDDYFTDEVPTAYAEKTVSPRRLKDKQLDRRFWKQLNRRRQKPLQLSA